MRSLEDISVNGKRVIVRLDLNVPLGDDGQLTNTYRLAAVAPTLHFLRNRFAKIIILSHLGQPTAPDPGLSLRPVIQELSRIIEQPIRFAPDLFDSQTKQLVSELKEGELLALENLRFDPGEASNSRTFARRLSEYGDLYVNDALSVCHRQAASVVAITEFLPAYAGLLLEREYQVLHNLLRHPAAPFVTVIGGAKIEDKLPAIQQLLKKSDRVLVGGGVANTFLKASGLDVKKSLIEPAMLPVAEKLIKQARGRLVLPVDYYWSNDQILDIGPNTIAQFSSHLESARTIFWNGNLGKSEVADSAKGSEAIAQTISQTDGTTVIAGGNTIELCDRLGLLGQFSFVSSGGGATLELLGGRELPGIGALR